MLVVPCIHCGCTYLLRSLVYVAPSRARRSPTSKSYPHTLVRDTENVRKTYECAFAFHAYACTFHPTPIVEACFYRVLQDGSRTTATTLVERTTQLFFDDLLIDVPSFGVDRYFSYFLYNFYGVTEAS